MISHLEIYLTNVVQRTILSQYFGLAKILAFLCGFGLCALILSFMQVMNLNETGIEACHCKFCKFWSQISPVAFAFVCFVHLMSRDLHISSDIDRLNRSLATGKSLCKDFLCCLTIHPIIEAVDEYVEGTVGNGQPTQDEFHPVWNICP